MCVRETAPSRQLARRRPADDGCVRAAAGNHSQRQTESAGVMFRASPSCVIVLIDWPGSYALRSAAADRQLRERGWRPTAYNPAIFARSDLEAAITTRRHGDGWSDSVPVAPWIAPTSDAPSTASSSGHLSRTRDPGADPAVANRLRVIRGSWRGSASRIEWADALDAVTAWDEWERTADWTPAGARTNRKHAPFRGWRSGLNCRCATGSAK
jgi:hypothetical protein